ncbi:DUF3306 domain-containing protein [Photobacterium sp. ZSDE20]|uniref:DUF3306 domain-containing protein n=1 Tax=Photobacterium pectinilyticum TaxID=2906793 RepID=A0ABT1N6N2_9GAMM|nr:DUF3306 domain-containing protein [Photobacterium sp. ZSDE20]MCQ1059504.1 DUF3306 domain-containing protein [Photobacterium sp. ZSDE20]MDD1825291.1 DUF3306 domain-containing protein [Photobacterium sp. ZSDE20]
MVTNFFQRWSQRKLNIRDEDGLELDQDVTASELVKDNAVDDAGTDIHPVQEVEIDPSLNTQANDEQAPAISETIEPQTTKSDLPFPDLTLADATKVTFDSGVSNFMKEGVEKSVKKAALRKLFHSDEFNYVSDMDDHTEDFSNIPVLDTKVTQQLRQWVNQVAETTEDMIKATGSDHSLAAVDGVQAKDGAIEEETTAVDDIQKVNVQENVETDIAFAGPTELETETESDSISDSKLLHSDKNDLLKG